jgi:hypothetical protein
MDLPLLRKCRQAINGLLDTIRVNPLTLEAESTFTEPVFDAEKVSLHQYSAPLSHISNDTAISSAHTMHCSAPLSHIYELMQGLELAKTLLCRENLKRDYTQQTLQVWDKHFEFAELKRKFPSLGTNCYCERKHGLRHRQGRNHRNHRQSSTCRSSLTDPPNTSNTPPPPKRLLRGRRAFIRQRKSSKEAQKERDHGYEDVVEVGLHAVHSSSAYLFVLECLSTPNISFPRRHQSMYRYSCRRMSKRCNRHLPFRKCASHQTVPCVLRLLGILHPRVRLL